jgi:membrane-bound metal-dependent hydrolase YbcI (DUF457 family)
MDPITHGLAGYVVAKTGLTRDTGRWGVTAGVLASLFPDVDSLLGPFVRTEFTIKYHRGLTNSLFLAVPFALFLAWLFNKISGQKKYGTFFLICFVEILLHNSESIFVAALHTRLGRRHRLLLNRHTSIIHTCDADLENQK